ncbi:hypothetical protein [Mycobacterium sp. Marseille-P9652]|uniref:hypothetical protein n=1 Tax=Mycobacterium sp. Marseille-P9652 TaxID=2654950 RepID=UPI0012E702E3|nr:hypothetical protein [Mycobacterium sp. Marseille-P9652]
MTSRPARENPSTPRRTKGTTRSVAHPAPEDGWQVIQASRFIGLLRGQVREMTGRLTWLERHGGNGRTERQRAMRTEAAALRRDIDEAEILIDRLNRRYLSADDDSRRSG